MEYLRTFGLRAFCIGRSQKFNPGTRESVPIDIMHRDSLRASERVQENLCGFEFLSE